MQNTTLAFIGAGNMATSLILGLIEKGFDASRIWASNKNEQILEDLKSKASLNTTTNNLEAANQADVVILSVKPQIMKAVTEELAKTAQNRKPLILSIAAGITIDSLNNWLGGNLSIVRTMPNTPALVQTGATGLYANTAVSNQQKALAESIMDAVGIALWVEQESLLDAVTAISGSGPAYFFLVLEAMVSAGKSLGLDEATAHKLASQTALGAAKMAMNGDVSPAELRRRVTSPGGTTEQALNVLNDGNLMDLFKEALTAARDRSKELAKQLGD